MGPWKTEKLGKLCSISIGGTPARANPVYWDASKIGSNLWASIKDLRNRFVRETEEQITDAGVRHSNAKLVKAGTVLMSFKLTIGRVAFAGRDLYTNEAIAAFASEQADAAFLYYGLQHWNLLAGVDQAIKGATLNKAKLKEIEVYLPVSRKEQRKIAEVLSTADRTIEHTEALIAKHRRINAGLIQDFLTRGIDEHGRLRDAATHKFKPSPLGSIPDEWSVSFVSREFEITAGLTLGPHRRPRHNRRPYIRVANVQRGFISMDEVTELEASDEEMAARRLEEDDLLVVEGHADIGQIGRCARVPREAAGFTFQNHLFRLRSTTVRSRFAEIWLNSPRVQTYWRVHCGTSSGLNTI